MTSIREWLESLGLGQYAEAFESGDIDEDVLPDLDHEVLRELGVDSPGHRLRILKATGALNSSENQTSSLAGTTPLSTDEESIPERRQLTVLFCDLVGSTEVSRRIDPEDLRNVLVAYQDAARRAIAPYDGYIARYMGDGLLIYFGYPQAHEDDAERAVRAGLDIVEAVSELEVGVRLAVRIGIATGLVVVGDIVGDGAAEEHAVLGETPNLAARLQGVATENSVVLAEATQRLIAGRFRTAALGKFALKGYDDSIPAFRAVAVRSEVSRFEAANQGSFSQISGREREMSYMRERWAQSANGEGQVVLLEGEPGIGKSRIAQALRDEIGNEVLAVQRYQCSPYFSGTAYYPVVDLLSRAAGFILEDAPETRFQKIKASVKQLIPTEDQAPALMAALLSLPASIFPPLNMTPQEQRDETIRVLVAQVEALALTGPLLILFEDAHWADPSTLELLAKVVERVQTLPVLVVITFRPEFEPPWSECGHISRCLLNRLGQEAARSIVISITGGRDLPVEVINQILEKTDGVPLFVEELTKTILESGVLTETEGRYDLRGPLRSLTIPSTLQDSLVARLDRLSPIKEIAQLAACIGREFGHGLISEMSGLTSTELDSALGKLVDSGIVYRRGQLPEYVYVFKHALIQDAARNNLLTTRRRQIHGQIAEALKKRRPEVEQLQPELLAHHYSESERAEISIPLWLSAAQNALQSHGLAEAQQHLERAEQDFAMSISPELAADLRLRLLVIRGATLSNQYGYGAAHIEPVWKEAVELSANSNDELRQVLANNGYLLFQWNQAGGFKKTLPFVETLLSLSSLATTDHARFYGAVASAFPLFHFGRIDEARERYEAGLEVFGDNYTQAHGFSMNMYSIAVPVLACILASQGELKSSIGYCEKVIQWMGETNQPVSLVCALAQSSLALGFFGGCHSVAKRYAEAAIREHEMHKVPFWADFAYSMRALARLDEGRIEEAVADARHAMRNHESLGTAGLGYLQLSLALALVAASELDEADGVLLQTEKWIGNGEELFRPTLDFGWARLHLARGRKEEAYARLERAMGASTQQGTHLLTLRYANEMATLLIDENQPLAAKSVLDDALANIPSDSIVAPDITRANEIVREYFTA